MLEQKADLKPVQAWRSKLGQQGFHDIGGAGGHVSHRQLGAYSLEPLRWGVKLTNAPGIEPPIAVRANQLGIERGGEQTAVQPGKALAGRQHKLLVSESFHRASVPVRTARRAPPGRPS